MFAFSWDFSENSGNSEQSVQYFSQMATLLVAFPKYSGYSSHYTLHAQHFSKGQEVLAKYMCFADIIYGINVEITWFPLMQTMP